MCVHLGLTRWNVMEDFFFFLLDNDNRQRQCDNGRNFDCDNLTNNGNCCRRTAVQQVPFPYSKHTLE